MIKIKPKYLYTEDNNKQGVVLTIKDFEKLIEELEDYYDYKLIKKLEPFDLENATPLEEIEKNLSW